jgi:plasmid stabilization system protein ParE
VRIVWSPLAIERVEDIAQYIADDNASAAVEWVERIFDIVERLSKFPESGRVVPEVGVRRIREVIFGSYRIIYSVRDQIDILTVRRSNQLLRVSELED